ncbi:hypothetical protein MJH12_04975 [bacterium]|nr:hypothetical protein [bacterium]
MNMKKSLLLGFVSSCIMNVVSFANDFNYLGSYKTEYKNQEAAEVTMKAIPYKNSGVFVLNVKVDSDDSEVVRYLDLAFDITLEQYKTIFESSKDSSVKITSQGSDFYLNGQSEDETRIVEVIHTVGKIKQIINLEFSEKSLTSFSFQVKQKKINTLFFTRKFKNLIKRKAKNFKVTQKGLLLNGYLEGSEYTKLGTVQTEDAV